MLRLAPAVTLTMVLLVACRGQASDAPAPEGSADHFVLKLEPTTLAPGSTGALKVIVTPAEGYKWNLEYPARLTAKQTETPQVRVTKAVVKKGEPEVAASESEATLALPVEAKQAGAGTVEAALSFSVCTKTTCHVYRDRAVSLPVTVQ